MAVVGMLGGCHKQQQQKSIIFLSNIKALDYVGTVYINHPQGYMSLRYIKKPKTEFLIAEDTDHDGKFDYVEIKGPVVKDSPLERFVKTNELEEL